MNKDQQLIKNSVFNTISFLINLFISFFFTPYLIKEVGKESYSFFPLVNNLINYSTIITTAVGGMAGRFVTLKLYQHDINGVHYYYNSVLLANWILSAVFTIISCIAIAYLPNILTIPEAMVTEVRFLFLFACGSMIIGLATNILGLGTFVKNRLDISASRTVIANLFRVSMILILFSFFKPSIIYMSISAFCAALLTAFYNIIFKKKLLPEIEINVIKYFKWSYLKELMSSSVWSSVNQLGMILVTQLDLLITNIFIGVSATGDYSIAKTIPSLLISLIATLAGVFVPSFNILYAKGENTLLLKELTKAIRLMGILSSIPIGFLLVYGVDFFNLWTPGQDAQTISWLSALSLIPLILNGAINPLFHIYAVVNKVKVPSLIFVVFGLLQTGLTFLLLYMTNLGLWSIPIASLSINTIKFLTFVPIYAAYCLNQSLFTFHKPILKAVYSCLFTIIIAFCFNNIIPTNTWPFFILNGIIVCGLSLIISIYINMNQSERVYVLTKIKIFKSK